MFFCNEQKSDELIMYNEKGEKQFVFPFIRVENVKYPSFLISQSIIYAYKGVVYYKILLNQQFFVWMMVRKF